MLSSVETVEEEGQMQAHLLGIDCKGGEVNLKARFDSRTQAAIACETCMRMSGKVRTTQPQWISRNPEPT